MRLANCASLRWLLIGLLGTLATSAGAQTGSPATYEPEELKRHFQDRAESYSIRIAGSALKLNPKPLMHWSNPIRSQEQGALYVWSRGGRPMVFGSVFTYQHSDQVFCRHELLSLAEDPVRAVLDGKLVWSPKEPAAKWTKINDVAEPSKSPARRLTQMRGIARQFSGVLSIPSRQPSRLTLKPQPVIRYADENAGVLDGAIFAIAVATDPEIWLRIEARESKAGNTAWYFAPARSHYHKLELTRNDQPVWSQPSIIELENTRASQLPFASQPYFLFHGLRPIPDPSELR